ncbi:helix-turn-helix domain-containing protein [Bacillus sp. FJAT-28004]|uniref:helix-turn-helix domain-containing protein n=1 Tax=Bacillus sp. FJAT-28004 TaxID=1679165 RepID=UPI0006B5E590|nr:helix-turn-helix transcriptional regulator [Bacillus sp. FJAT-28004]
MNFQERLKKLRLQKGLTQDQLASALDIPATTIRRLETVDSLPRRERLDRIADFFNVSIDYLTGRTDEPEPSVRNHHVPDSEIYIAYLGGPPEEINEEEAEHLKQQLEMFRLHKEKRKKEREQEKDNKK